MIDFNGEGFVWLGKFNKLMNKKKLVFLDMEIRCVRVNWYKVKLWLEEGICKKVGERERESIRCIYVEN